MSQTAERAKAIKQIRALTEQTVERGQSEAHANLAMKRIDQLMRTFNISMDEVSLKGESCVQMEFSTGSTKRTGLNFCTVAIGQYLDCIIWFSRDRHTAYKRNPDGTVKRCGTTKRPLKERGDSKVVFFGLESDAQMAVHLCDIIQKAINYEAAQFKKGETYKLAHNRRGLLAQFEEAMASRISHRLNKMKDESDRELRETRPGQSDIVILKSAKVKEAFKTTGTTLRASGQRGHGWGAGSAAGHEAGDKVNLNRPIEGGTRQILLG
jgi:hypothetical protein